MNDRDTLGELSPQERHIAARIKEDALPPVQQEDIRRACQIASRHLCKRSSPFDIGFWHAVFSAMTVSSAPVWIIGALALGMGARVASAFFADLDLMSLLFALAPVPIMTLAIRELSDRDESLAQVERTCKYSPSRVYLARLWIGVLLNAIAVAALGACLMTSDFGDTRIWLCSFIAMFLVGAVALLVMSRLDHALPLSVLMAVWVICSAFAISQEEVVSVLNQLSYGLLAAAILASIAAFLASAAQVSKRLYA